MRAAAIGLAAQRHRPEPGISQSLGAERCRFPVSGEDARLVGECGQAAQTGLQGLGAATGQISPLYTAVEERVARQQRCVCRNVRWAIRAGTFVFILAICNPP